MLLTLVRCVVLCALAAGAGRAALAHAAQPAPPDPAFVAWWERVQRTVAAGGLGVDQLRVEWTVEELPDLKTEDIAALRAQVAEFPEHPLRRRLNLLDLRARGDRLVSPRHAWIWGTDARTNMTADDGYFDVVVRDNLIWGITDKSLQVADRDTKDETARAYPSLAMNLREEAAAFLNGGLFYSIPSPEPLPLPDLHDGRWALTHTVRSSTGEVKFRASGAWRSDAGWGTIDESSVTTFADGRAMSSLTSRAGGWTWDEALQAPRASSVTIVEGTTAMRRQEWVRAERIDRAAFESVTALPANNGSDPVRGVVTFRTVRDSRGDGPARQVQTASDGTVQEFTEPPTPRQRGVAGLDTVGWILTAVIVTALIVIRVRKK